MFFPILAIAILSSLILAGCNQETKLSADYISHWEGKGNHWSVTADIPYSSESTEQYFKVSFTCDSTDYVYDKSGKVFFALITSSGNSIYVYDKSKGFIKAWDIPDPSKPERIVKISDVKFEVIYNMNLIDTRADENSQVINVQLPNETIQLQHVSS